MWLCEPLLARVPHVMKAETCSFSVLLQSYLWIRIPTREEKQEMVAQADSGRAWVI